MRLFENPDARCPKNPKKFLFFRYEGYHDVKKEDIKITSWGPRSWHKYELTAVCRLCGGALRTFGITDIQLIRAGFTREEFP